MDKSRIKAADIDAIVYDFDGVMTDNKVLVDQDGREAVFVNRSDGLAVAGFRRAGIPQAILSTETNPVVEARARKLQIPCRRGLSDKAASLAELAAENGWALDRIIFVGNDANDLGALNLAGYPVVPADGHDCARAVARFVTRCKGGEGVVRELYDLVEGLSALG